MEAKEKAEELVNKYLMNTPVGFHIDDAKQCALIAVNEIIEELIEKDFANRFSYWQEVKHEIINL